MHEKYDLKEFYFKTFYLGIMMWNYLTPGIPDELFERSENVPITKEDIRSIVLSNR